MWLPHYLFVQQQPVLTPDGLLAACVCCLLLHTGTVEAKGNCKVMVLGCGLECATTEAKGTVLIHTAEELKNFTKGEEAQMEEIIKGIKNAGTYFAAVQFSPHVLLFLSC